MRLSLPWLDDNEAEAVARVLETGMVSQGRLVAEFEQRFARRLGVEYAFATSSATTALHLALVALEIGPGDDVLVPDFTFPATGNVVIQVGANPILVDIALDSFTVDPADLARKLTPATRAVMPVHAFGCPADMDPIRALAAENNLVIVEDAACALGATYQGEQCGKHGSVACFSFHGRKIITTGEGGMITTDNPDLAAKIQILRSHGAIESKSWRRYTLPGFNYRMSDVHAAIGLAQLDKLETILERRSTLARKLKQRLAEIPGITRPSEPPWGTHAFQSFVILLDVGIDRDGIIAAMAQRDIETTIGTYALHEQPLFSDRSSDALPNSRRAFDQALTLPLYPQMTEGDLDKIAGSLAEAIRESA